MSFINIKTIRGDAQTYKVHLNQTTVQQLKVQINAKNPQFVVAAQRLFFAGIEMANDKALSHVGVQPNNTIHLVLNLSIITKHFQAQVPPKVFNIGANAELIVPIEYADKISCSEMKNATMTVNFLSSCYHISAVDPSIIAKAKPVLRIHFPQSNKAYPTFYKVSAANIPERIRTGHFNSTSIETVVPLMGTYFVAEYLPTPNLVTGAQFYEQVLPGLNYHGLCSNKSCEAYSMPVTRNRGFGTFKQMLEKGRISCPACNQSIIYDYFILYKTRAVFDYCKSAPKSKRVECTSSALIYGATTLFPSENVDFQYLTIQTEAHGETVKNCSIDICVVLDCTASMDPYIEACRKYIHSIVKSIQYKTAQLGTIASINFAVVAFRDYKPPEHKIDYPKLFVEFKEQRLENMPFTTNYEKIQNFIAALKPDGGYDKAEDVLGGLDLAMKQEWTADFKFLLLIGDAPCHGSQFNNCDDNFPNGDPAGITAQGIFKQMKAESIHFYFGEISKESTKKMVQQFKLMYDNSSQQLFALELVEEYIPKFVNQICHYFTVKLAENLYK